MISYSQRRGLVPLQKTLQLDSLDDELRNRLWSAYENCTIGRWDPDSPSGRQVRQFIRTVYVDFFKRPADTYSNPSRTQKGSSYYIFRDLFLHGDWNIVLDLLEFTLRRAPSEWTTPLAKLSNRYFEEENAGFRIISNQITDITDPIEIAEVATALESIETSIATHIKRAIELLSNRENPDYRNSIKESISSVEAGCMLLTGKSGGSLSECVREIKRRTKLHPAFEKSLLGLYGYTSDSGGIRHALSEDSHHPTYAEAKFMLVTCSAFINYLKTVIAKSGNLAAE